MGQEYQWAEALRKAKKSVSKIRLSQTSSKLTLNESQLLEQLEYYKMKLAEAAQKNNQAVINPLVERLIKTHAKLTALFIKQEKENGATDDSPNIQNHLAKYYSDCSALLQKFPQS